jgi:surface protein
MKNLFWCSKFSGKYGDISDWDVSKVEDMSGLFNNSRYNGDISDWDVSSVENMDCMFWGIGNEADDFDPEKFDLSKWNVSSVTDMSSMFAHSSFNSDISNWDVSNVESMNSMFMYSDFNQDISSWVISSDTDTRDMFDNCPLHDGGEFRDDWKPVEKD